MISQEQLSVVEAPVTVYSVHDGRSATVTGFSKNDPLGVGGYMGIIPDLATAYFEGGGWCLVRDLCQHWSLDPTRKRRAAKPKS